MAEINGEFSLPIGTVVVKPVLRDGVWLERGHSGNFQYDNCVFEISAPLDRNTGYIKEILTPEERAFFEDPLKSKLDFRPGDLMSTKKEKNFWKNYSIRISKPESIVKDETVLLTLDLSKPFDYIKYAILRANTTPSGGSVAPTWAERHNSGTYKVVMVKDEETLVDVVNRSTKKKESYKFLTTLEKSSEDMYDFLSIYWLTSRDYKQPSKEATKEFYIAELEKLVETDLDGFVEIVRDSANYPYKLLLHKAVRLNIVSYSIGGGFTTVEGIPLGLTMNDAVSFLKNPKNQEHFLRLDSYVKNNK